MFLLSRTLPSSATRLAPRIARFQTNTLPTVALSSYRLASTMVPKVCLVALLP